MKDNKKIDYYLKKQKLDLEMIINDYSAYISTIIDNMSKNSLNKEDKEEIASEVFFILWKNEHKLHHNKTLSSYIAGITKNIVKEFLRNHKTILNISDYTNSLYLYDEITFFNDDIEEIKKIEKILNTMKEIDKEIFISFYYFSKSIKDIAKEQNISEFNVKQRLYRIRNKIKKEV